MVLLSSISTQTPRFSLPRIFFWLFLVFFLVVLIVNVHVFSFSKQFILSDVKDLTDSPFPTSPNGLGYETNGPDGNTFNNRPIPVAIVLGASVYSDGSLSPVLEERAQKALELYRIGVVSKILVSGDNMAVTYNEVMPIRKYLLDNGVAEEDVFADFAGFNTYDSMYRAREIFGAEDILVVTQSFHLPRAVYTARHLGLNAYGVPADGQGYHFGNNIREIGATVKTFYEIETGAKPAFLGPKIPIDGDGRESLK